VTDPKPPEEAVVADADADAKEGCASAPPMSRRQRYESAHEISTRAAASILGAPSGLQAIVLTGSH